jgi:hypothetical protein
MIKRAKFGQRVFVNDVWDTLVTLVSAYEYMNYCDALYIREICNIAYEINNSFADLTNWRVRCSFCCCLLLVCIHIWEYQFICPSV